MKRKPDGFTLVIAGGWNQGILSPEWLSKHVFDNGEVILEVAVSMIGTQFRNRSKGINIRTEVGKLVIFPDVIDETSITQCEIAAKKLCELLPHTPAKAIGLNSAYIVEQPSQAIRNYFDTPDNLVKIAQFGGVIKSSEIRLGIRLENKPGVMNFRAVMQENGALEIYLNKHFDAENPDHIKSLLNENEFWPEILAGLSFIQTVYELELELENEE